jgi:choline dehydrogenase-like flavoprotein
MANLQPREESVDVVVIGAGAGGGVVAKELGEAGLQVVVLESGRRFAPEVDYPTDRTDFEIAAATVFEAEDPRRDVHTTAHPFDYVRAKGVGGSTLRYLAISPRFHESDFRTRSEDGVGDDWPLSYADLEPYYERVEQELGVSGPNGPDANPFESPRKVPFPTAPHPFNLASRVIRRGADKLGLHLVREPVAIPTSDWNGRPACINAGTCGLGCRIRAKSSIDVTYVPKAEATGRVEIRPSCTAREISLDGRGRAGAVIYHDDRGAEHEIRGRAIVIAGNAIETPRLLLLSRSSAFPDGLANSSGLVGKYFMEHLAVFSYGLFDERLDPWRGIPTGGMLQDYYATSRANDFARGWTTVVSTSSHWPLSVARRSAGWGAEHKARTKRLFGHFVGLASVGEQLPSLSNEVTLDPLLTDRFGVPVPRLVSAPRENDVAMVRAIAIRQAEILAAAGATETWGGEYSPGTSAHYLGTCRMGSDPKTSVVNAWGRAHDVQNLFVADGSVFVTGAGVNPALTISSLATRTAEGIVGAFTRREL